jgi:hypothetical protein
VLEHLAHPEAVAGQSAHELLSETAAICTSAGRTGSRPWGGHEFSPLHYLGPVRWARVSTTASPSRKRFHQPHANLFPTYIGSILKTIRDATPAWKSNAPRPATTPSSRSIMAVPGLREVLAWNCALLLRRKRGN